MMATAISQQHVRSEESEMKFLFSFFSSGAHLSAKHFPLLRGLCWEHPLSFRGDYRSPSSCLCFVGSVGSNCFRFLDPFVKRNVFLEHSTRLLIFPFPTISQGLSWESFISRAFVFYLYLGAQTKRKINMAKTTTLTSRSHR